MRHWKRHVSQHVHEIIPKEAISDCSGVSKFKALMVHHFFHWPNLIVIAKELDFTGLRVSRGRGVGLMTFVVVGSLWLGLPVVLQLPFRRRGNASS